MKERNVAYLREALEQIPTDQLDEMLHNELCKEPGDESAVRMIMEVLEERDADRPVEMNPEIEKAWGRYQAQAANHKEPEKESKWLLRAASITVLVFALVATIPQEAEASGFFERIARWTESIFELFIPGSAEAERPEYVFETDNPGLQEVYDAVTELGVTEPVVPMWLPEGYELASIDVFETPFKRGMLAGFSDGTSELVLTVDVYEQTTPFIYEKTDEVVETVEHKGAKYFVLSNNDNLAVVWCSDSVECMLTVNCSNDVVHKIIKSIKGTE